MTQWFEYNELQVVTEGVRQYRYGHQRSVSLACTSIWSEKRSIKSNVPLRKEDEDYTQTAYFTKNGGTKHCNVLFKWCTMEWHVSISLATHTMSIRMYSSIVCLNFVISFGDLRNWWSQNALLYINKDNGESRMWGKQRTFLYLPSTYSYGHNNSSEAVA